VLKIKRERAINKLRQTRLVWSSAFRRAFQTGLEEASSKEKTRLKAALQTFSKEAGYEKAKRRNSFWAVAPNLSVVTVLTPATT